MRTLLEIYDPTTSDKNTNHSYITDVYEDLLKPFRHKAKNILEIGTYEGGSLFMWRDYFDVAHIYGIESFKRKEIAEKRITQIIADGYDDNVLAFLPSEFDIIIDDGPHSLPAQLKCIDLYLPLIKEGGLLIIEDIADYHTEKIIEVIKSKQVSGYKLYDLRANRDNRWDNIVLVVFK